MTPSRVVLSAAVAASLSVQPAPPVSASHGATVRVSLSSSGEEGQGGSYMPAISADGRFVAFVSSAPNLVPGDTNGWPDVFVHDRVTGETERVSVSSSGEEASWDSAWPSISADGRYVAFTTWAGNIAGEPPRSGPHIVVHDRLTRETSLGSVASDGGAAGATLATISADGRWVGYVSNSTNILPEKIDDTWDVFLYDLTTGQTDRVVAGIDHNLPDSFSWRPALSADGRFVAFQSDTDVVPGGDPWSVDIFLHDRQLGTTVLVSKPPEAGGYHGGASSPTISADGRYVAFAGPASMAGPETNARGAIFVYDAATAVTTLASRSPEGSAYDVSVRPSLSADGRLLAFISNGVVVSPEVSPLWVVGKHVQDLTAPVQVYVRDLQTRDVVLASSSTGGQRGNGPSEFPIMAAAGRSVVFQSEASNLVRHDENGRADVFVHELFSNPPTCSDGGYEEGNLSGPLHEIVEPELGPLASAAHDASCGILVPREL